MVSTRRKKNWISTCTNMVRFMSEKCLFTKISNDLLNTKTLYALKLCSIVLMLSNLCNGIGLHSLFGSNLPCNFYDSINITDGTLHPNQSIIFNGIEYPSHQYAIVNHYLDNELQRKIVKAYVRGCVCNIRFCIRFCCPFGTIADEMSAGKSVKCHENDAIKYISNQTIEEHINDIDNLYTNNNSEKLIQQFTYIEQICIKAAIVHDEMKFVNLHKIETVKQHHYCLKVIATDNNDTKLQLMMCKDQPKKLHLRYSVLPYGECST